MGSVFETVGHSDLSLFDSSQERGGPREQKLGSKNSSQLLTQEPGTQPETRCLSFQVCLLTVTQHLNPEILAEPPLR